MRISYLPHTADVRMRIECESLKDLYVAGLRGMGDILKKGCCKNTIQFTQEKIIEIQSSDYTCLLIDFLSEVLSLSYVEKSVFCRISHIELSKYKIKALIQGAPIDFFDEEIKAVTYHEANVYKNDNNHWETNVIFDI